MVDVEKEKTKGEEVHEEIQRIRYETVIIHRSALSLTHIAFVSWGTDENALRLCA